MTGRWGRPQGLWKVHLQRTLNWALLLPFGALIILLLRWAGGYRIENLEETRRRFRELSREKAPLLVCGNHLTFIDSALMLWAFASTVWYLFHYRFFSWNLPAGDFFAKKLKYRVVLHLSKCIFLYRDGPPAHQNRVLTLCRHLLEKGEVVTIFPEGQRSRSGRVEPEKMTHGAARLIESLGGRCRVLCVYVRGDKQEGYSDYPPRGSLFRIRMELLAPSSSQAGRQAYHEITAQIGGALKRLEEEHFHELAQGRGRPG